MPLNFSLNRNYATQFDNLGISGNDEVGKVDYGQKTHTAGNSLAGVRKPSVYKIGIMGLLTGTWHTPKSVPCLWFSGTLHRSMRNSNLFPVQVGLSVRTTVRPEIGRPPACHTGGRGFECRRPRQYSVLITSLRRSRNSKGRLG